MRLDHVSYACGPEGLAATVDRLARQLGVPIEHGGLHPRFGTTNAIAPLADGVYLEVVAALDHPASDKAPFGQAVKRRSRTGGGWLGWVIAVDDIAPIESRLDRPAARGHRVRPDGAELHWLQIGVNAMIADPLLPFFVQWMSDPEEHPAVGSSGGLRLTGLELAGDPESLSSWLSDANRDPLDGVHISWVDGDPGIVAAHLDTPNGPIRIT
jgi:hypothetical protein